MFPFQDQVLDFAFINLGSNPGYPLTDCTKVNNSNNHLSNRNNNNHQSNGSSNSNNNHNSNVARSNHPSNGSTQSSKDCPDMLLSQFATFLPSSDVERTSQNFDDVPDVSTWTCRQIADHFRANGFSETHCHIFIDQVRVEELKGGRDIQQSDTWNNDIQHN